jgi:hypothetical protein
MNTSTTAKNPTQSILALSLFAVVAVAMMSTTMTNAYANEAVNGPLVGDTTHVSAPLVTV